MNIPIYRILCSAVTILSLAAWSHSEAKIRSAQNVAPFTEVTQEQLSSLDELKSNAASAVEVQWDDETGSPRFLKGNLMKCYGNLGDAAIEFISKYRDLFRMDNPAGELTEMRIESDMLDFTHVRLQQNFGGIPIKGGEIIAHFRPDGMLYSLSGRLAPTPKPVPHDLISLDEAEKIATDAVAARFSETKLTPDSRQVFVREGGDAILTWEVTVTSPSNASIAELVYVDAHSGEIVLKSTLIMSDGPAVGTGIGLDGQSKTLHTYQEGSNYLLLDASRDMFSPPIDSLSGVIFTWDAHNGMNPEQFTPCSDPDQDNVWDDSERQRIEVDLHYYLGECYEFYRTAFNRNSYDNQGGTVYAVSHYFDPEDPINAFWSNNRSVLFSDGGGGYRPFAGSYDVVVHEITHGVTQYSSNLVYLRQSGALNEHMSDAMACVADSEDWYLAEDVRINPPGFMRSMEDPHLGTPWQPAHMNEFMNMPDSVDHGGVHFNSGIPNHAFYLVASTLNRHQAGTVWYRANTQYLTSSSQFADLRLACIQSATDLYGANSAAVNAVTTAFDAVGIGGSSQPGGSWSEGFDSGAPDWIIHDADGANGTSWALSNFAHTGQYSAYCSYGEVGEFQDQWLISSPIMFESGATGATLTYFTIFDYPGDANEDHFVKIGADPNNLASFSTVQTLTPAQIQQVGDVNWVQQTVSLGNLAANQQYYLAFQYRGTWADSWYIDDLSISVQTPAREHREVEVPTEHYLASAYPNPFNPSTTITFALASPSFASLKIYDVLGREIAKLVDGPLAEGTHTLLFDAADLPSGTYLYRLQAGSFVETRKMTLLK